MDNGIYIWPYFLFLAFFGMLAFAIVWLFIDLSEFAKKIKSPLLKDFFDSRGNVWIVFLSGAIFLATGFFILPAEDKPPVETPLPTMKSIVSLGGFITQKASFFIYRMELKHMKDIDEKSEHFPREARKFFVAGERAFKSGRYKRAADNYQKSFDSDFTFSSLLNNGISRYLASDVEGSWDVFQQGLQVTLSSEKRYEAIRAQLITNMGIIYASKGSMSRALSSFYDALDIAVKLDQTLGQAQHHCNIGLLLEKLGKNEAALENLEKAHALYQLENMGGKGLDAVTAALGRINTQ
ncbi:MAG: tetratricopeptide repeat protein [Desulfobacterales bacterium]|nr:tetratricopeptide repeat protein [Desulfobacterales bacterium]